VAHYRAGDWKAAVAALDRSEQLLKGGNACNWLFLAMAHWKLGQHDEARVESLGPDVDLAMHTVGDRRFFDRRRPLRRAARLPRARDPVEVYGFPVGGSELSVTRATISRLGYGPYYQGTVGLVPVLELHVTGVAQGSQLHRQGIEHVDLDLLQAEDVRLEPGDVLYQGGRPPGRVEQFGRYSGVVPLAEVGRGQHVVRDQ
jgi:hypothetical protein